MYEDDDKLFQLFSGIFFHKMKDSGQGKIQQGTINTPRVQVSSHATAYISQAFISGYNCNI